MRIQLLSDGKVIDRLGNEVELSRTESRVLAHLVLSLVEEEWVDAIHLGTTLWPEERPIARLHTHLANLRKKLPDDIPRDRARNGLYATTIDRGDVDVWVFYDLARQDNPDAWEAALALWPKPDALAAFGRHPEADILKALRADTQERWISVLIERGAFKDALFHTKELLSVRHYSEEVWAKRVLAVREVSGLTEALIELDEAIELIQTEVGAPPFPLIDLRRKLRASPGPRVASPATTPPRSTPLPEVKPHVDRPEFLRALLDRLEESVVAAIDGVPGNGKTTVAADAVKKLGLPTHLWTFRPGVSDSVYDFLSGLADFLSEEGDDSLATFVATEAAATTELRIEYRAAVAADALSSKRVILFLDDVHAAEDQPFLASFLKTLLTRLDSPSTKARVILIGRWQTKLVDVAVPGTLHGLSDQETRDLLEHYGVRLRPRAFDRLYRWSSGNVKALRMFAEWVTSTNAQRREIERMVDHPEEWSVNRNYFIEQFLAPLDEGAFKTAHCMSLLRKPISWRGLWALVSEITDDPKSVASHLTRTHVAEEMVDGSGFYLHSIHREFLRATGTQQEKERLHMVAAKVQQQIGAPVEHLYHLAAGGDLDAAATTLCKTYDALIRSGEAAALAALVAGWDIGSLDRRTRYDLNVAHAQLLRVGGHLKKAIPLYEAAAATADSHEARFACELEKAVCYRVIAKWEEGLATVDALLANPMFPASGTLKGRVVATRGSLLAQLNDPTARAVISEGITSLRQALQDPKAEADLCSALTDLGWFELMTGDLSAADRALKEANDRQQALGDDWKRCKTLSWIGRLYWQGGRWIEAEAAQGESLSLAEGLNDRLQVALAKRHLGLLQWNRGNYKAAHSLHREALEVYELAEDRYGEAATLLNIAAVHFDEGDLAEAKSYVDVGKRLCLSIPALDFYSYALLYDGKIAIRESRFEQGLALTREATKVLEDCKFSAFYIGMAQRATGEGLLGLGRLDEAEVALKEARATHERLGSPFQLAKCLHWLGCLAERRGLGGEALWIEALETFEAMGAGADARRTRRVLEEAGYG